MTGEEETYYFIIDQDEAGERIDRFLADKMPDLTRSFIQKLIKDGCVLVNGASVKANYRTVKNDQAELLLPPPDPLEILPENIPLDILYEDEDLLVVNKPKGMVVHPAAGHYSGTLVNAILYHCGEELSGINGVLRPGIVHRIRMIGKQTRIAGHSRSAMLFGTQALTKASNNKDIEESSSHTFSNLA